MSCNGSAVSSEPPSAKLDERLSLTGLILPRVGLSCFSELGFRSLRRSGQSTAATPSDARSVYRRSSGCMAHCETDRNGLLQSTAALHIIAAQAEQAIVGFVQRGKFLTTASPDEPVTDMDHPHGG